MKTKQQSTITITLIFCIAFTMLFPSMAVASIWITVPFDMLLNQLGKDYSTSTKPNNYISRAEFAKIAVYIAGKQALVENFKKNNSIFQDVKPEEWFNGYVNVAVAEGLMNGNPNSCFYPRNETKQGEALTVLFRILGYNDNLPRKWPANYVNKAASLNAIDDSFSASKIATYDELFIMCNKALDQYIVQYNANLDIFKNALKEEANIIENSDPQKKIPYTLRQKIL